VNAVHPLTHLFDGYLIHSRGANASTRFQLTVARLIEEGF